MNRYKRPENAAARDVRRAHSLGAAAPGMEGHPVAVAADSNALQRAMGNQAVGRMASGGAPGLQAAPASSSAVMANIVRRGAAAAPTAAPVVQRKVHARYERQWQYALDEKMMAQDEIDKLRAHVEPLKGSADKAILDLISMSNFLNKKYKDEEAKRKRQTLMWIKLLETNFNLDEVKKYRATVMSLTTDLPQAKQQSPLDEAMNRGYLAGSSGVSKTSLADSPDFQLLAKSKEFGAFLGGMGFKPITDAFIEFYQAYTEYDKKKRTRAEFVEFVTKVIQPRVSDLNINSIIERGQNNINTLITLINDDATWQAQNGEKPLGPKVEDGLKVKAYNLTMAINSSFHYWMSGTKEGREAQLQLRQDRNWQQNKFKSAPGIDKYGTSSPRQQGIFQNLAQQAKAKAKENRDKAIAKVEQCENVTPQTAEATLDLILDYIKKAPSTINFKAGNIMNVYEMTPGYQNSWALGKPTDKSDVEYFEHRNKVEQEKFGFDDDPSQGSNWQDRPVYAGANMGEAVPGAAEQYGGSYMVLKESAKARATYAQKDTFSKGIENIGTYEHMEGIIADMDVEKIQKILDMATGKKGARAMDSNEQVEVHIHGPVRWDQDIEKLVIDRTEVPEGSLAERRILAFAKKHNIIVEVVDIKAWKHSAMFAKGGVAEANLTHKPKLLQDRITVTTKDSSGDGQQIDQSVVVDKSTKTMVIGKVDDIMDGQPKSSPPPLRPPPPIPRRSGGGGGPPRRKPPEPPMPRPLPRTTQTVLSGSGSQPVPSLGGPPQRPPPPLPRRRDQEET